MSDTIIAVENLSKQYLVGHHSARRERYTGLRDVISREALNFVRRQQIFLAADRSCHRWHWLYARRVPWSLARQFANEVALVHRSSGPLCGKNPRASMKLLLTTPILAAPPVGGPELRVANTIQALARVAELHVFPQLNIDENTRNFLDPICKKVIGVPEVTRKFQKRSILVRAIRRGINKIFPTLLGSIWINRQARIIARHAEKEGIDAIWFSFGCISYPLMRSVKLNAPNLRLICDTDSVWSQFLARGIPFQKSKKDRNAVIRAVDTKINEEKRWVKFCEITTAVCEADARYYRNVAQDSSAVYIFRNAIDTNSYDADVAAPENHRRPNLVMLGSYYGLHSPMVQSARWIIRTVLPHVRAVIPGVHLYLVGKGSDLYLKDLECETVTATGRIPSTLPYLKHADVALAPLLFEAAGTKFKVLEAAMCEVPIVATTVGAEGLPIEYRKYIRVSDEPKQFAAGIIEAFSNHAKERDGRREFKACIDREFGLTKLSSEGAAILRHVTFR